MTLRYSMYPEALKIPDCFHSEISPEFLFFSKLCYTYDIVREFRRLSAGSKQVFRHLYSGQSVF